MPTTSVKKCKDKQKVIWSHAFADDKIQMFFSMERKGNKMEFVRCKELQNHCAGARKTKQTDKIISSKNYDEHRKIRSVMLIYY